MTYKILILSNNCKWKSWDKKIQELKAWFEPTIQLEITLKHTTFTDVPFEGYQAVDKIVLTQLDQKWYEKNLVKKGFDIILFQMKSKEWKCLPIEGKYSGLFGGTGKIQIGCDEKGNYNFNGVEYPGDKWFNLARHEICHALYALQGKTDNTHKWWFVGNLDQVLKELSQSAIVTTVTDVITPPKKYKYFNYSEVEGLKPELVELLDRARDIAGIPFKITSGYRSPAHNMAVGGVKDSSHTKALAVDISANDSVTRFKIVSALVKVGFKRIGCYKSHIHCDIGGIQYPQEVMWILDKE